MIYRTFVRCFSVALLLLLMLNGANAQDPKKGEALFLANCASCHKTDMKGALTGPALGGTQERWAQFPASELYDWIRNSQGIIGNSAAKSQSYAKGLFAQYANTVMTPFPALTDADIDDILLFVKNKFEAGCALPPCAPDPTTTAGTTGAEPKEKGMGSTVLWALAFVLIISTILLARYVNNLNRLAQQKQGEEPIDEKSFFDIVLNRTIVRILVFALVILGGYTTVNNAIGLGRQQNYAPDQPIKFSHALHAGKNEIDCQYCHDGARRSKHSIIPATNTCMNCHSAIQKGPEYGTAEILKIYASAGFNPISAKTPQYGGAYFNDTVSVDARLAVYKQWLQEANKDNKMIGESELNSQLAAARPLVGKTIEWIRIHNMPDHVYFNHAQHVTVGKVACQDCHGQVQEMAVVKQYAPLSMGWCVNCHRQTKVKFEENGYYKSDNYKMYEQYHSEVKSGKRNGVTVEEIGGLECQKCHY